MLWIDGRIIRYWTSSVRYWIFVKIIAKCVMNFYFILYVIYLRVIKNLKISLFISFELICLKWALESSIYNYRKNIKI